MINKSITKIKIRERLNLFELKNGNGGSNTGEIQPPHKTREKTKTLKMEKNLDLKVVSCKT